MEYKVCFLWNIITISAVQRRNEQPQKESDLRG